MHWSGVSRLPKKAFNGNLFTLMFYHRIHTYRSRRKLEAKRPTTTRLSLSVEQESRKGSESLVIPLRLDWPLKDPLIHSHPEMKRCALTGAYSTK